MAGEESQIYVKSTWDANSLVLIMAEVPYHRRIRDSECAHKIENNTTVKHKIK
jgi:hypothetical protein